MRNLIGVGVIAFLLACSSKKNSSQDFLSHFEEISFDTLSVYSGSHVEADTFKFKGKELDTLYFSLFPKDETINFEFNPVHACFKFSIDNQHTGLILRVPSEYVSSWVKVFTRENASQKFVGKSLPLAESIGDAGYGMEQRSWLFKSKNGVRAFTHVEECEYEMEPDEETEEQDTTETESEEEEKCVDTFALHIFKNGKFQKENLTKPELEKFVKQFKINAILSN
ncbi:MAG: hypothetical protein KF734_11105 [Saprospiraceae bacterium]|nr:hypothetical protein [Saprospiraceae bacterium]